MKEFCTIIKESNCLNLSSSIDKPGKDVMNFFDRKTYTTLLTDENLRSLPLDRIAHQ